MFSDLGDEPLPAVGLLPLENPDLHDPGWILDRLDSVRRFRAVTLGRLEGHCVALFTSKFGAPAVAVAIEAAAEQGLRVLLAVGFCGGLREEMRCGDLFVPEAAARDDGTSLHYVPSCYPAVAHSDLVGKLRERALQAGIALHEGIVWSTDGVLRESSKRLRRWNRWQVSGVDMECGTLFTVSRLRGVQSAAVLIVTDHALRGEPAVEGLVAQGTHRAWSLALKIASEMAAVEPNAMVPTARTVK